MDVFTKGLVLNVMFDINDKLVAVEIQFSGKLVDYDGKTFGKWTNTVNGKHYWFTRDRIETMEMGEQYDGEY